MSWAKLDQSFWAHPKLLPAGNAGVGVFARMLSYCAKYDLERLPKVAAAVIGADDKRSLRGLVASGALTDTGDGFYALDPAPSIHRDVSARRLREARARGYATAVQVQARIAFYGGLCWICRTAPYEAIDHVKPIAHGGSKWPANLRPACTACNSRKGAQWPYEVTRGT